MYTIDSSASNKNIVSPNSKPVLNKSSRKTVPWTTPWMVNHIKNDDIPMAVGYLRSWMPNCREREASEYTVMELRKLDPKQIEEAVKSLKSKKRFVRGTKGQDLKFKVTLENVHNGKRHEANALLDSGATGTCINHDYVLCNNMNV